MKELVEKLQSEVVELTRLMKEKSDKGQSVEVKELSDKLVTLQKEFAERKHAFDVGTKLDCKEQAKVDRKMDELFIAHTIMRNKDGQLNKDAYGKLVALPEYRDAIKASGFSVDGMTSTGAGIGDEFVPEAFSATLKEEIWLKLEIANLFQRIPMPAATFTLPFAPGRLIARAVAEGGAPTKDKAATGKLVFTAKKIMSNVEFSDEFEADSIVAVLPFVRKQLIDGFALSQETMALNGDTGTGIYGSALTGEDCRKLVKGIRADAAGASANVDIASGGFSADNLRALRAKMGKFGKSPSELAYIMSMADYNKALGFTGYQALYQYAGAVTTTGELGRIDNIPVIVSELIPQAGVATDAADSLGGLNASGKFDGTTYTKTCCVLVNKNGYMWGDRNTFALETFRNPFNQQMNLIGSQRLDFEKVLATADKSCSVGINY
jgi:HK97 family phage major capsid protein